MVATQEQTHKMSARGGWGRGGGGGEETLYIYTTVYMNRVLAK